MTALFGLWNLQKLFSFKGLFYWLLILTTHNRDLKDLCPKFWLPELSLSCAYYCKVLNLQCFVSSLEFWLIQFPELEVIFSENRCFLLSLQEYMAKSKKSNHFPWKRGFQFSLASKVSQWWKGFNRSYSKIIWRVCAADPQKQSCR